MWTTTIPTRKRTRRPLTALLGLCWALMGLLGMGGGAGAQSNLDVRYNFDRLANGPLAGWADVIGTSTVQNIDDGLTGRKGFGAAANTQTLYTAGGLHSYIEGTYSFVLHTNGSAVNESAVEWCANAGNTSYYSLTPVFRTSGWQCVFITAAAGSAAVTDLFTLPDQSWTDGTEANCHWRFDAGGLHYNVWKRAALQPSGWMREVGNGTLGTRLPAGYTGLAPGNAYAGPPALALDYHAWDYSVTPWYSSETVDTVNGGQAIKIIYPPGYNASVGCPLMLFFHGAGGNSASLDTQPEFFGPMLAAGYAVAACDAHGDNWGSPASQADYVALYNYCAAHMRITRLVFGGGSMGSLDELLALVKPGIPTPSMVYDVYPVGNRQAAIDDPFGFAAGVQAAYGGTLPSLSDGNDPARYPPSAYPDIPYVFLRLQNDTAVLAAHNTDVIRTLLASKRSVKVIDGPGTHGDPWTDTGFLFAAEQATLQGSQYDLSVALAAANIPAASRDALIASVPFRRIYSYTSGPTDYNPSTRLGHTYDPDAWTTIRNQYTLTIVSGVTTGRQPSN